jgi:hypothetical protein
MTHTYADKSEELTRKPDGIVACLFIIEKYNAQQVTH